MPTRKEDAKHDRAVEDSFPASDPPAPSGVVGPRVMRRHERDDETRHKGTQNHDRRATETAYQWEHQEKPGRR